ncbi:MAG: iron ABC transporter permease [Chloroflexi bacterium HGW-Chloroflexi-10]|nr:MAG: iron ABC transporter permease [Chloroflexi bacterium HGW-Chloroflexi-10]
MAGFSDTSLPWSQRLTAIVRRVFHWLTKPHVFLSLIMLVIIFYMVIIPLYRMVMTTITVAEIDLRAIDGAEIGDFTLYHWVRMLSSKIAVIMTFEPLVHSLTISLGATVLALTIGGLMAWMVVRTDMPGREIVHLLATIPYIMPSWTIAMAWTVLFKNRTSGGTPGLLEFLTGSAPPDWLAYGPIPIIISSGLHYYTFFFLFVSAALLSIDSSLEEAGELAGASRSRIMRKITFPLVIPAIASGFIMTFSKTMGTFGGPNVLGVPVRYYTLSTMLRSNTGIGNYGDAFVLAVVLIMFAMTTVMLNQKLVGTRKSYETIGGRGFMSKKMKLRNWKGILTFFMLIFEFIIAVLPLSLLIYSTLMLRTGDYSLSNFTLAHWIGQGDLTVNNGEPGVLLNPKIWKGAWNSIRLSLFTAFFTALFGVILGYAIVKGRGTRLSKLVEQLSFIPYVIPGIAFGAVYISMFTKPFGPIPALYGTFALLVVVSVAKHIPYSSRSGVSAMLQVSKELEEAAAIAGAGPWHRFKRIIFPLTSTGFVSGFLLTFITTMRELSLIILLVTPSTAVLASMTMRYIENGNEQQANAVIIILITLVLIGNFIISRFRGGSLKKGLGM